MNGVTKKPCLVTRGLDNKPSVKAKLQVFKQKKTI
jgi:uncharacterized ferritin-like protein (DUF455 family)